jgi:transcription antitermination factor NusG
MMPNSDLQWFALRVKPHAEKTVDSVLRSHGIESLLPIYADRRRWSDRIKSVDRPLFPGYLFCRPNPDTPLKIVTVPGAVGFVGFGRGPQPIPAPEINAIMRILDSGRRLRPLSLIHEGQRVSIQAGPLAGLNGRVVRIKDDQCLVVSIELLQRSVAVAIDGDSVEPCR